MLKKEHLLNYMLRGHVHLSKKDYSFFNNLVYLVKDKKYVTTNQDKLFDKLILKYQRQLNKLGYKLEDLSKLNWSVEVVSSLEEFLVPKIYLGDDDRICLRAPYKSTFLNTFRATKNNTFVWNREEKIYTSHFYTHSLKMVIDLCKIYFDDVTYCDKIKELVEPFKNHTTVEPTLVEDNGTYTIKNSNKHLSEAIKDIELKKDYKTIFLLSTYGIAIDQKIINNDPIMMFASEYNVDMDLDNMLNNPKYFAELGITDVYFPLRQRANKNSIIDKEIVDFLKANNIKVHIQLDSITDAAVYIKRSSSFFSEYPVLASCKKINKIVQILNSRPISVA